MNIKHNLMHNRPELTISIISSGREDKIERCLSSLQSIRDRLLTELIIVNTAPENEKVEDILKNYADVIIDFDWCDDFSAARNVGLEKAHGRWFLYIDDDEWFEDTDSIVNFIKSLDSFNYDRADLVIRNYVEPTLKISNESIGSRMVKVSDDVRFRGCIHEYFYPTSKNFTVLDTIIHHDGYVYVTEEEKKAHSERNITLLKKQIELEPRQTRWWHQLLLEYDVLEDWDKQRELSEEYIDKVFQIETDKNNEDIVKNLRGLFVSTRIRIECRLGKWETAYELFNKYVHFGNFDLITDAHLALQGAIICFKMQDYYKALGLANIYLKDYDYFRNAKDNKKYFEYMIYFLSTTFTESNYITVKDIKRTILDGHKTYIKYGWEE